MEPDHTHLWIAVAIVAPFISTAAWMVLFIRGATRKPSVEPRLRCIEGGKSHVRS